MERVLPIITSILRDYEDEGRLILLHALNASLPSSLDIKFRQELVSTCLLPLCKWKVGKQAAKVRSLALNVIRTTLEDGSLPKDVLIKCLLAAQSNADDDWDPSVRNNCVFILMSTVKLLKMQDFCDCNIHFKGFNVEKSFLSNLASNYFPFVQHLTIFERF